MTDFDPFSIIRDSRSQRSVYLDRDQGCYTCHDSPLFRHRKVKEAFKGCIAKPDFASFKDCINAWRQKTTAKDWVFVGDMDHVWIHTCNLSYSTFFCEMCATNVLVTGNLENLKMEVTYTEHYLMMQLKQELQE